MVIAAVDPNKKDLKLLVKLLRLVYPSSEVLMFTDPKDALKYLWDNPIDVLYTEVTMLGMTGFGLQQAAEAVQPALLTVFVTGTDVHAAAAIRSRAQGYVLKPVTGETLRESLNESKFNSNDTKHKRN